MSARLTERDLAPKPTPQRDMWADERRFPWLLVGYIAAVLLGAFLPSLIEMLR